MATMQVVFLFDLNAFNDDSLGSSTELHRQQLCLRLACLRILTHYSVTTSNLKWGFKFFNSQGTLTQTMQNFSFPNVSLESFEILENEIFTKYQRHFSYLDALAASSIHNATFSNKEENTDFNQNSKLHYPVQLLHLALTQILCEYQWNDCIDMFSPSTRKKAHKNTQNKNMLFLVSKCPSNDAQFQEYFGVECTTMTVSKFTNILLSQSLNKQLLDKASILWVWLNTSADISFLGNSKPSSLLILANTLKSLKCTLVPLCVLSELKYILKLKQIDERKNEDQLSETLPTEVAYNSLVPFSSTFLQSVSYPFYLEKQMPSNEAEICFQNNVELFISVSQVPVHWNRIGNNFKQDIDVNQKPLTVWKKFTVQSAVSKHVLLQTDSLLLLLPSILDTVSSNHNLRDLIKSLMLKSIYLLVVCESMCGLTMPAVLSPLSHSSAVVSLFNSKACFLNKAMFSEYKISLEALNFTEIKKSLAAETEKTLTNDKIIEEPLNDFENLQTSLKPFQMECTETWFEPTSAVTKILTDIQQTKNRHPEINSFQDKLSTFYKNCKKHKKETSDIVQKELPESTACLEEQNELEEIEQKYKDITYEQLISILNDTYDAALKSNGDTLLSAKKIIKLASSFFLKKSIISYEENMKNFMAECFLLTNIKIVEKYKSNTDEDATMKKINECKLQALLALEVEVLFPSSEGSSCADNVTHVLGLLSFLSSSTDYNKFVTEVLKENYRHNLYDNLLQMGLSDDDSIDSPLEDRFSGPMSDPFGSAISSTLSVKSSSSSSSRGNSRKLIKKRSDISDTNKSRQVLLPGKSPKRKRMKYNSFCERNAIRYSPRLASKKKKSRVKTIDSNPETARRNLFSRDRKPHTPRISNVKTPRRKKANTPKTHHVLKTNFVPETPSHKQSKSALQRRKSQMEINSPCQEVKESPLNSQTSKGISHFNRLQKLKNSAPSNTKQESSNSTYLPSCSYQPHRTPESKRRLSLKLFSKVLASPTARMGLKKCSKRLFDQISPQVFAMPSKKIKLENNFGSDHSHEIQTPKKNNLLLESCTPKKITSQEKLTPARLMRSQEKYTPKKSIMSQEKHTPMKRVTSLGKRLPKKLVMSQEKHTPRKKMTPNKKDTNPC